MRTLMRWLRVVALICLLIVSLTFGQTLVDSEDGQTWKATSERGVLSRVREEGSEGSYQTSRSITFLKSLKGIQPRVNAATTSIRDTLPLESLGYPLPITGSHDLHDSYQKPLHRLSDSQLRTLLRRYNDSDQDVEQFSRKMMIGTLENIIRSHNQRLLRPRLLTNVNVLAPSNTTLSSGKISDYKAQHHTAPDSVAVESTIVPMLDNEQLELVPIQPIKTLPLIETSTVQEVEAELNPGFAIEASGNGVYEGTLKEGMDALRPATTATEPELIQKMVIPTFSQKLFTDARETTNTTAAPTDSLSSTKPAFTMLIRKHKTIPEERKINLDDNGGFTIHDDQWNMKAKNNRLHSQFIAGLAEELQKVKNKYEAMKLSFLRRLRWINERYVEAADGVEPVTEDKASGKPRAAAARTVEVAGSKAWEGEHHVETVHGKNPFPGSDHQAQYDQYAQPPREIERELQQDAVYNPLKLVPNKLQKQREEVGKMAQTKINNVTEAQEKHTEENDTEELNKKIKEFFETDSDEVLKHHDGSELKSQVQSEEPKIEVVEIPPPIAEVTESPRAPSTTTQRDVVFAVQESDIPKDREIKSPTEQSKSVAAHDEGQIIVKTEHVNEASISPRKITVQDSQLANASPFPLQGVNGYRKANRQVKRIYSTAYSSLNSGNTEIFRKSKNSEAELMVLNSRPESQRSLVDSDLENTHQSSHPLAQVSLRSGSMMDALRVFETDLIAQETWVRSEKTRKEQGSEISTMELLQKLQDEHHDKHQRDPGWHHHLRPTNHQDHNKEYNQADANSDRCNAIACNFENGDTCEWESSRDTVSVGSKSYYTLLRRRAHRQADFVIRGWQNWQGRYRNSLTGIARAVFSLHNQRFAASYVKPNQRSLLSANLDPHREETVEFHAWEAARNVQLRVCCDTTERCVFETEIGVKRGSRKWKMHYATCPKGTKKIIFECVNYGIFQGACGVDNIRLLDPACPEVFVQQFLVDSGDQQKKA